MLVIANDELFSETELAEARRDTLALQRFFETVRLIGAEAVLTRKDWSVAAQGIMALHEARALPVDVSDSPTIV